MSNIKIAQAAKAQAALNRLVSFNGKVMPLREFIEDLRRQGYVPTMAEVPSVKWNRRRYNNMTAAEQEEFDKKYETLKQEYRAQKDNVFYTISKTAYEYMQSLM